MVNSGSFTVRPAIVEDWPVVAQHFRAMWRDNHVPNEAIAPDWQATIEHFLHQAQATLEYQAFLAIADEQVVGSAGGQLFAGLYPNIHLPTYRKLGYIWGVYVEPAHRRQGIGKQLTQAVVDHLRTCGCTQVVLNAAPSGRSVYEQLGFVPGNLMTLDLRSPH